jgi:stearoyl-CoA desaturase (delta-9 desaturase)
MCFKRIKKIKVGCLMLNLKNGVNWVPTIFLITYQLALFVGLPFYYYYNSPSISLYIITFVLYYMTGLCITGGYHRHYSHRAYKTNKLVEWFMVFFGAMAGQGSILRWSYDHRIHHANVDTDDDPYSISKGFWYAHFLWIIEKPREICGKVVPDLMKNKLVVFQHDYYGLLFFGTNALVVLIVGWVLNDYWGALALAVGFRLFLLHHSTWFINSLAHTWGDKPFSQEHSAVNNYVISFLTFGEGYHNYHHTYANDYRNGVYWYQFDPTKWLIWGLSKIGLTSNLKRVDKFTIKKRMIIEHKNLLLESLMKSWQDKRDELEPVLNELSDKILAKINELTQLKNRLVELQTQCCEANVLQDLKNELNYLQRSLKQDWKAFWRLSKTILATA